MNPLNESILCRTAFAAPLGTATDIMYMPAGLQSITPSQGGKSVAVKVMVDAIGAAALEAQRAELEAKGKRPYFDFNHEDREASFWPTQFYWRAEGIYARGEWSDLGGQAITGKRYRQFSPVFYVDNVKANPARIVCRSDAKPNMGGLVNDPAFHSILPFWAKDSTGAAGDNQNQTNTADMNEQELAALRAKILEQQRELDSLKAKETETKQKKENADLISAEIRAKEFELKANQAAIENAELKAKAAAFEAADLKRRQDAAKAYAAEMVKRGALAAKDNEAIADVERNMTERPEVFAPIYAKWAGDPSIGGSITRVAVVGGVRDLNTGAVVGKISAKEAAEAYTSLMAKQKTANNMEEKKAIARDAGLIFCADLKGNDSFLDLPLSAANSLGTLAGTLVTQRTLELLKLQFPILGRIWTDFSDESANYAQQITTRIVGIPTVGSYSTSTGYAQTDQTATDVSVTMNAHKYVQTSLNANNLASTMRRLFDEFAPANAYAIAKDLVDAIYALILAADFTNATTCPLADFTRSTVIDMGTALNIRGVPQGSMNRTLLLYSDYFGKLAQDPAIVSLAAFQKSQIITDGTLPDVHGFSVGDAPNLPDNSENLVGAGFSKSAMVLAGRLPNDYTKALPGASFGNVSVVTNPDSGMSVMQVEYVDHTLGSANQRLAWMYGKAKGQPLALQRLKSA